MKAAPVDVSAKTIERHLTDFAAVRARYVTLSEELERILGLATTRLAPLARIESRPKSLASFAEKLQRKKKYTDPLRQITDLCGARVITCSEADKRAVGEFIRRNFAVDPENSMADAERHRPSDFGYRSTHFVVQLKRGVFPNSEVADSVREEAYPDSEELEDGQPMRAEIQVRTFLDHVWAVFCHDRAYKGGFKLPDSWERELNALSATLESADATFERLGEALKIYEASAGVYFPPAQLAEERTIARTVFASESDGTAKVPLALRIARLARAAGDWKEIIKVLTPFAKVAGPYRDAAQLELGRALCLHRAANRGPDGGRKGWKLLCAAAGLANDVLDDPEPILGEPCAVANRIKAEAMHALAKALSGERRYDELTWALHRRAHESDRANPYLLAAYLEAEVCDRGVADAVFTLQPLLRDAITVCRKHVEAGIELPGAWFAAGLFHLCLGESHETLVAYARGAELSLDLAPINEALGSVEHFQTRISSVRPQFEWVQRLLRASLVAKAHSLAAVAARDLLTADERVATTKGAATKARDRNADAAIATAEAACAQAASGQAAAAKRATTAPHAYLHSAGIVSPSPPEIVPPVMILAGTTHGELEGTLESYRDLLLLALAGFRGTLISGGTTAGIAGVVGDFGAQERAAGRNERRVFAYLPSHLPATVVRHAGYQRIVETGGTGFSALEVIQSWVDLLAVGVRPDEVRLLGVGGGELARLELQLALALGAQVGVVQGSGRAVDELLRDPDWSRHPRLVRLIADPMTLRAFIHRGSASLLRENPEALESAARAVHERYLETERHQPSDPARRGWEELDEDFRDSNRDQAAFAIEILRATGFDVRRAETSTVFGQFTSEEIERMAAMEHGRWNVERLADGWRLAPERDATRKLSPYLVPWSELPEKVREWDRDAVRRFPETLAKANLEVFRRPADELFTP